MGNAVAHEPLSDSVAESSALEQTTATTDTEIVQNGPILEKPLQNSVQSKSNTVDTVADVKQDTGTFTSPKTIEMSSNTNAEEKELEKSAKAVSKSRFSLSFSRSVPGRTNGPSAEPTSGAAKLQANQESASVNTASVDKVNHQESSSQKGSSAQKQQQLSTESSDATEHPEKETEQPKQKEVSFFDKLFKPGDKGKLQNDEQGALKTAGGQDPAADNEATELIHRLDSVHQYLETGDGNKDHITSSNGDNASQNPALAKSSENLKESEKGNKSETPADDKSVMNFFKTLVTPTKSSSKTELDPQQASDDKKKVNGEHKEAATKAHKLEQKAAEQQEVSSEKAKLEKAPTQSPFGKLFKQKTIKELPQDEQENVTSTTDAKAEKGTSQAQKQITKQESKSPESAQKVKSEEVKPAKKGFLNFFKQMSVTEDEKHADSVDSPANNSEGKESGLTDDPAKKRPETRENSVQPAKKGKDDSKQKKFAPEGEQEEPQRTKSLEALPPTQQPNATSVPIPNGNDIQTKDTPEKRLEKKQSFGGFLKQLGGKKTADAAVQTDPVVIAPAGKAK